MSQNPLDEVIVATYNQNTAQLNAISEQMNKIRVIKELSPKEKQEVLKAFTLQQNLIKRNLIETYRAYGISP